MEKDADECGGKSVMDVLDDNTLSEILLHLPMKTKFQCKAVCKRWLHLISTPFFAQSVLAKEQNGVSLPWNILYEYDHDNLTCPTDDDLRLRVASEHSTDESTVQTFIFNFPSRNSYWHRVYGAHRGLMLCSTISLDGMLALCVCNPLTGKWIPLPEHRRIGTWDRWELIGFIVSFNNGSTEFKVVRASSPYQNNNSFASPLSNFEVFCSDVGEWRDTGVAFPQVDGFGYYQGFNGVVHDGKLVWRVGTDSSGLLVYDPVKNECRVLSFNVPLSVRLKTGLIGTSCGRLCYANYATSHEEDMLSVCVVENYETEEWRPLVMTQMSSVLDVNEIYENDSWYSMMPLAFHPFDKNIVYYEMRKYSGAMIVSFNIRTKRLNSFSGEEIPKGFHVKWPISLFVVPPWPTSVPQQIWDTTSIPQPILETTSVPDDYDNDFNDDYFSCLFS